MKKLNTLIWKLRIYKDTRGQDLIEYALMVGFIAVAAGAVIPGVVTSIRNIFEKISSALASSANQQ
jgi:pilus assembly protein Flp/PilA